MLSHMDKYIGLHAIRVCWCQQYYNYNKRNKYIFNYLVELIFPMYSFRKILRGGWVNVGLLVLAIDIVDILSVASFFSNFSDLLRIKPSNYFLNYENNGRKWNCWCTGARRYCVFYVLSIVSLSGLFFFLYLCVKGGFIFPIYLCSSLMRSHKRP
jgi:hypothetical protein